ncbi:MAG: hypothetical protein ACRDHL_03240, partial [Candidatus Promineifilaceae bacterium]
GLLALALAASVLAACRQAGEATATPGRPEVVAGSQTGTPRPPTPPIFYPGAAPAARHSPTSAARPGPVVAQDQEYFPLLPLGPRPSQTPRPSASPTGTPSPTLTATPTPSRTPLPSPTPTPTIDFRSVRAQLQAQGQDLGFVKIGFHTGVGGNRIGLGEWMARLDAAGVPFFLKGVDDSGPLLEAQELKRASGVPHTLVFRRAGQLFDSPDYSLPPAEAARRHWQLHRQAFPAELDPSLMWLETLNEVDKNRADWLGYFALETARLALADGFNWAAFGWAAGEPEPAHWQTPGMLAFLRLAAANPDRLAIALHEYSLAADNIGHMYPYKVGRFQQLYQLTDQLGLRRPTVLITEWGWEHNRVPGSGEALADIAWAANMYAPYPEVKGAAIWYLGIGWDEIANQVQPLIRPLTELSLGTYYAVPLPPARAPINPEQFRPG